MEEEIQIINENTKKEKLKNFFIKNSKYLIISISAIIVLIPNYKSNEIASNTIMQKIDLANAYINMGKKTRAQNIIERLEKNRLSKSERRELNKLKKIIK